MTQVDLSSRNCGGGAAVAAATSEHGPMLTHGNLSPILYAG